VNGDEATARSSLMAIHIPVLDDLSAHADIGAMYHYRCIRTPDGWLFSHVRVEIMWTGGLPLFAGLPPAEGGSGS
jgi:hypothetical protein